MTDYSKAYRFLIISSYKAYYLDLDTVGGVSLELNP